ncbi:hypothetical protein AZI86_11110 [Bdellovibrio bacteriovorus]|uniref:Polysaccharide biosynthesis protein C-terminal domain-containing protein n=1 Tax=Bdellovibrio bacteriovorus TaxID=959 RepID=A0A150WLE0_BDEBC|nr:oligosaccharide flippase family protein [Bdellovibrio bacteriovorus]KYG64748.1 hypothetical protein AZI86_11110 [Bdellovibrio bacteriovorus]
MINTLKATISNKILRNTTWIFAGNVVWVLISFGASIVVARTLSLVDYGTLQLASTWFLFIQLFENLAHPNVAKIEMVKNQDRVGSYIIAIGLIGSLVGIIFSAVIGLLFFVRGDTLLLFVLMMTIGQAFKFYSGIVYYFDNKLQALKTQIILFFGNSAGATYRITAAHFSVSSFSQVFVVLVTNVTCVLGSLAVAKGELRSLINHGFDRNILVGLMKKSAPLLMVSILSLLVYRQDILILGFFGMERDIALYSNAVKISEPWGFIASGLISSMLPGLILSKSKSLSAYYRRLRMLFFLLSLAAIALAAMISIFADVIVRSTFGAQYGDIVPLLRVHIWSNLFLFYVSVQQVWEANESMHRFLLYKTVGAVLLNLVLNYCFVPKYGAMACAINSVVTYFFLGFGVNMFTKKTRFINGHYLRAWIGWKNDFKG